MVLTLGLTPGVQSPDAKTIWLFREQLVKAKAIDKLFGLFDTRLKDSGYLAQGGQIIDATVIAAPRQAQIDDPFQKAQGQADASAAQARQCRPLKGALSGRDCLCCAETPHGPVCPNHRH